MNAVRSTDKFEVNDGSGTNLLFRNYEILHVHVTRAQSFVSLEARLIVTPLIEGESERRYEEGWLTNPCEGAAKFV